MCAFICMWLDKHITSCVLILISSLISIIILIYTYTGNDNKEADNSDVVPCIVYDVTDYQIDTNIFIKNTDTLKTYTITYYTE